MFLIPSDDRTLGHEADELPRAHARLRQSSCGSYRELPLRLAEAARCTATSCAGTLHGLTRVRHVTQDDAHLFCAREQIEDEVFGCLDYAAYLYELFGLEVRFELSTRPENRLGTDEEWDFTEGALQAALERRGLEYELNEGDGAFYGPKIDLHMTDSLGRSWQMGTIQLDSQMPARFGLTYVGADNHEHTPYVIHRAIFGSLERFIGILIEHYAGAFPVWLAPVQVRVLPVGEDHREAAHDAGGEARGVPRRGRRVRRDGRQADPQRRGREDPVRRRLGRQGVRRRDRRPRARGRAVHEVARRAPCVTTGGGFGLLRACGEEAVLGRVVEHRPEVVVVDWGSALCPRERPETSQATSSATVVA